MRVLLRTDNLLTRSNLESTWLNHGAQMLDPCSEERPELIVVDLNTRDVLTEIRTLQARYPGVEILVFGPHVNGEAFKQARAAGATTQVARGKVLQRVIARLQGQPSGTRHEHDQRTAN